MDFPASFGIFDILSAQAQRIPANAAFLGLDRPPLTYQHLYEHVSSTVQTLNSLGIGRGDRVAMVLPQGPELAVACLALASGATCVPFAPLMRAEDYEQRFAATGVRAVVIQVGLQTPAWEVARKQNLSIFELSPVPDAEAGIFTLAGQSQSRKIEPGFTSGEDIAVVGVTSGTTSLPKIIPISHAKAIDGSIAHAKFTGLTEQDRLLNLWSAMNRTTIHEFLELLTVGGSVACPPEFDAALFFGWLDRFRPTFTTATANVFRTILAHAPMNQQILARCSLRFLHSVSMTAPPQLLEELERTFKVPVSQSYGSTECGLASTNPLPPRQRKPGSVGLAVDVELRIVDEAGNALPLCQVGEIWLRSSRLVTLYENNPEATQATFIDGWHRTGDLGYLDQDNYLFITGRLKEFINRGGVKISPYEIEDALLTHPAVKEAAAFAVPDVHVGEELAVAIVRHERAVLTEQEVRQVIATRLDEGRIPRRVVFVEELPKTALGKLQRLGLAERLGLTAEPQPAAQAVAAAPTAPATALERQLVEVWAEILKRDPATLSTNTQFRDVGGDSLAATRLIFRVREKLNVMVTILDFFDAPTIAQQAQVLERLIAAGPSDEEAATLIPIRTGGKYQPLFCIHALDGGIYFYQNLVPHLDPEQPIYGLQAVGMDGTASPLQEIPQIAAYHVQQIKSVQMHGPYFLCGYSLGGRLALEIARQLREGGTESVYVSIIDTHFEINLSEVTRRKQSTNPVVKLSRRANSFLFAMSGLPAPYRSLYIKQKLKGVRNKLVKPAPAPAGVLTAKDRELMQERELPPAVLEVKQTNKRAALAYVPQPYDGPILYIRAGDHEVNIPFFKTWKYIARGPAEMISVPGTHENVMHEPQVQAVAATLQQWLDKLHSQAKH